MADKKISDLTAATVITAGDFIEIENAAGNSRKVDAKFAGIGSGTSFPGSPATGDRFWRSDRNILYFYDGTRWLSTQVFVYPIVSPSALMPFTTSQEYYAVNPHWGEYDIYALKGKVTSSNSLTTAANYFTFQFRTWEGASASSLGSTVNGQNDTQSAFVNHDVTINAVVASTVEALSLQFTETGTASAFILAALQYRLVG